jgi:hypothetical protein
MIRKVITGNVKFTVDENRCEKAVDEKPTETLAIVGF